MDNTFQEMITLQPSIQVYLYFLGLALVVGLLAGFLPALFFSKVNATQVLKDLSSVKLFKHISLRKGLIIFQYSISLLFIVAVGIEYKQYHYSLNFDLGFTTDNILTVDAQENKVNLLEKEFLEIAEVKQVSKANYISSVGASYAPGSMRYKSMDSVMAFFNFIDENYILLHDHKILAGKNFTSFTTDDTQIVVNEKVVRWR
jgi:putative ABC transport system permease protein